MGIPLQKNQWRNEPAFLVGGGPSLKGFDWSLLRDRANVIVVNRAFKDIPTADVWFSEDFDVITRIWGHTKEWREFKGCKILHALDPRFEDLVHKVDASVHFIRRKREGKYWSTRFEDGLSYSSNSMIGALNIAHILGADPIYLLGVDCNVVGKREVNYHDDYERAGKNRAGSGQYGSFISDFENWAARHLRERSVYNLNEGSAITCWPRVSWRNVLIPISPEAATAGA